MPLRTWISILLLFISSQSPASPVASIKPVVAGFVLDGSAQEWVKKPPTLSLIAKSAGARAGNIWLAQSSQGLVIAGKIKGPPPVFAKSPEDMPNGDHVEIWMAIADKVALPPIGAYSSMDGVTELRSLADCKGDAECKTWFASQVQHRRLLPRLFVRQWQLAPGVAVETYTRAALEGMRKEARDGYQHLSPEGLPEIRFAAKPAKGYEFEALIPWDAMPPSDRLNLDRLRVMVDVFSPGVQGKYGAFSTTSGNRRYGAVDTLNKLPLTPPRRWRLSPCEYPLVGKNFWARVSSQDKKVSKSLPAFFLPEDKDLATVSFVFDNDWIGRFWTTPTGVTPAVEKTEFFSQRLSPGLTICGPELAARHGNQISYGKNLKIEPNPTAKKVPGGWLLKGAWNGTFRDPEGQCGACENIYLNLHFVPDSAGPLHSAFQMSGIPADCCGGGGYGIEEITLSDDFNRIRVRATSGNNEDGKTTEYCFDTGKHVYLKCQPQAKKVAPPQARQTSPDLPPVSQEAEAVVRAQVLEVLAMAVRARVMVTEYYQNEGRFPADNTAAGIARPEQMIGNYVVGIRVEDGAIHIQFGNRADTSIAGKWLSLRPAIINDNPGGPVSWWCGYAPSVKGMTAQGQNLTSIPATHLPWQCRER